MRTSAQGTQCIGYVAGNIAGNKGLYSFAETRRRVLVIRRVRAAAAAEPEDEE